jgi:hypothetical protein
MLAHARPVQGMEPYSTLDAEGLILCAGMHASERLFSRGLKAAWDALWTMKQFSTLDWERLEHWVYRARIPRGFWVPMRVLSDALELPFPQEFLSYTPRDTRQQKLEATAQRYLFRVVESPLTLNPFSRYALFLLLHDSWLDRGHSLASWVGEQAAKSPRGIGWPATAEAFRHMPRQLRQVMGHWRQYRQTRVREA